MQKVTVLNYLSMIKFSHTVFALPFAVIGYFIALRITHFPFDIYLLLQVVLCMVFARNAAMAFNRYADRNFDKLNPRTFVREIPSGIISAQAALAFVLINSALFIATTYYINSLCFALSPIALLVILGYSITKRFTALCHIILGLGLSLAPVGAYLAVANGFHLAPILLSISVLCWVGGFDIIYALQDDDFDRSQNLKSIPVLLGRKNALLLSRFLHLIAASAIFTTGLYISGGSIYFLGASVFTGLLVYQHTIISVNNLNRVNLAFFTTNGVASVVFLIFFLIDFFI